MDKVYAAERKKQVAIPTGTAACRSPFFALFDGGDALPVSQDLTDALFRLAAREHHLTPAAEAAQPEIHAGAQHLPAAFAARVRLFHDQNVLELNVHCAARSFLRFPTAAAHGSIS